MTKAAYIADRLYQTTGIVKVPGKDVYFVKWPESNGHARLRIVVEAGAIVSIALARKPQAVEQASLALLGQDVQKILAALGDNTKASGFNAIPTDAEELSGWQEELVASKPSNLLDMVTPTTKDNAFGKLVGMYLAEPNKLKLVVAYLEVIVPADKVLRYGEDKEKEPLAVMFNREWLVNEGLLALKDRKTEK